MNRLAVRVAAALALVAAVAACDDGTGVEDTARIQVVLTDAPSDYISEAFVDIGAVELLPSDDGDRIVLAEDGTDGPIDLLDLQGLTTELLADLEIPSGTYHELRMIIESASVTLADGYQFNAGGTQASMTVPSGAQSGLKLKLRSDEEGDSTSAGVEIAGGQTVLVVDFDVNQSFVIQGNPNTPAGINGVSFKPVLRVLVEDVAGSISGTVTTALGDSLLAGLVVSASTVDPGDNEEFQSSTATAVTDSMGVYTIWFVAPGDYAVTVSPDSGYVTTPDTIPVTVGPSDNVTGVDFELIVG